MAVIAFGQDQNLQEAIGENPGGNPREVTRETNLLAGLGKACHNTSATSVERTDAFLEMIMRSALRLGNNAGSAEVRTIFEVRSRAKGGTHQEEEGETRVDREAEEPFRYEVYQAQREHRWQGSMLRHSMAKIKLGL